MMRMLTDKKAIAPQKIVEAAVPLRSTRDEGGTPAATELLRCEEGDDFRHEFH
jgi:hypothetical protein